MALFVYVQLMLSARKICSERRQPTESPADRRPADRRKGASPRAARGFTLVELMMVIVLVAILLAVGGPAFQGSLQRNRLQTSLNTVISALSFARSEAVIRNSPVGICPTTDSASCSGSAWEAGWLVFVDDGGDGSGAASDGTLNGNEELLRIQDQLPAGVTARTVDFPSDDRIVFEANGSILQDDAGTFAICDARGAADGRGVVVLVSGQNRLSFDQDNNGVVEDNTATDLVCPST